MNYLVEAFKIAVIVCAILWIGLTAYAAFEIDRSPEGDEDKDGFRTL